MPEMDFGFATARRIRFGSGVITELPERVAVLGRRVLLVVGSKPTRHQGLRDALETRGISTDVFPVEGEPSVEVVVRGVEVARAHAADVVVGVGGGSAVDAGKAIAALLTNSGSVLDYLEIIGAGRPLEQPSAPYIAVPTTSGTGAEVTKNAVLKSVQHGVKVSLRSDHMLPTLALVDPELTVSLPPGITAHTGLDALTQCLEPFVSKFRNPLTDGLCREGMNRAARSLRRAYTHGSDLSARVDMSLASLLGGLALANAGLGAVHGFAGPLGGMCPAPHGAICARLLPYVLEANVRVLHAGGSEGAPGFTREQRVEVLARYDEIGRILTGRADANAQDAIAWVRELCTAMGVPALKDYGLTANDIPTAVAGAARSSSMKGNPLPLSSEELEGILERALHAAPAHE